MSKIIRCYSELILLPTFEERFEYLRLQGRVGETTFGYARVFNQLLYRSRRWQRVRGEVLIRDNGCDLGIEGYQISERPIVHHMNPITLDDIENERDIVFNPEYLISTSGLTHNAIHYGDAHLLPQNPIVRTPNDTCPWR